MDSMSEGRFGLRFTKSCITDIFSYKIADLISISEMIEDKLPIVKE